jgi:D-alanine transaminase
LYIFHDGEIVDSELPAVKALDRGMVFGDGIYDVIKIQDDNFLFLEDHVKRMKKSADFFGMNFPYDVNKISQIGQKLSKMNDLKEGELYLQLTRGVDRIRDHIFEDEYIPTFIEVVQPVRKMDPTIWQTGVRVLTFKDMRHGFCEHKTVDLLPNVLAKKYARTRGAYEVMMFREENGRKYVTEGASSSYIFFDGKNVIASKIENILPGITRAKVLSVAKEIGLNVIERRVWLDEVFEMKEVILLSTLSKVLPIVKVDDVEFKIGDVSKKLGVAFKDFVLSLR